MNRHSSRPVLSLFVLAFLAIPPARADLASDITTIVDHHLATSEAPGAVVGVWKGGENIALVQRGLGDVPNNLPISASDYYRIGSVTKTFTVTRILQMADEGLLNLDEPISNWVPSVQNNTATLRQLANMTSGIFNYTEDSQFVEQLSADITAPWTNMQLIEAANRNSHYSDPGGPWHYSNTATVLLGMVVEQVATAHAGTPRTLGAEITDHILTPVGLTHIFYPGTIDMPDPYTHGYFIDHHEEATPVYGDMTLSNPTSSAGSGAMISNLDDMQKWARVLATGTLLSPGMQAQRLTLVPSPPENGPEYDGYGLGIGNLDGFLGHTGAYFGYQNLVMYDDATDQTVIIYTNLFANGHVPTDMFREIAPLLVPEPSTWALLGIPLAAIILAGRKKFKSPLLAILAPLFLLACKPDLSLQPPIHKKIEIYITDTAPGVRAGFISRPDLDNPLLRKPPVNIGGGGTAGADEPQYQVRLSYLGNRGPSDIYTAFITVPANPGAQKIESEVIYSGSDTLIWSDGKYKIGLRPQT